MPTRIIPQATRNGTVPRRVRRAGFTLVEVLTVIAIIGVLVGLLIPAISAARRYIAQSAMAFEVLTLSNAIDQYKNKYGDFPPDGSNSSVLQKHLKQVFPNMAPTELVLLDDYADCITGSPVGVMDPPEALVFFLGGFSDDPAYPFSGVGGPFFIQDSSGAQVNSSTPPASRGSVQYNVTRNNPFFEFKQEQLYLDTSTGLTISTDEALLASSPNDLLPAFRPSGSNIAPYVYFDSRTYSFPVSGDRFFNYYAPSDRGVARPYKSDDLRTTVAPTVNADAHFRYADDDSFQIIGAGLDDFYGGIAGLPNGGLAGQFNASPVFYAYPSGQSLNISNGNKGDFTRYSEDGSASFQLDNVTSFSDGVLEDALP